LSWPLRSVLKKFFQVYSVFSAERPVTPLSRFELRINSGYAEEDMGFEQNISVENHPRSCGILES
jgi:hypothetical protein